MHSLQDVVLSIQIYGKNLWGFPIRCNHMEFETHSWHVQLGRLLAIKPERMCISIPKNPNVFSTHWKEMKPRTVFQLSCFCFVLVLAFGPSYSFMWEPKPFRKNYVKIVNNLNNKFLYFHCKSRDDDLGLRNLQPNIYWEFSFHRIILGSLLYFCNFWYDNFHIFFDAFRQDEHFQKECSGDHYIWIVQEDGLYFYELKEHMAMKNHDWEIEQQMWRWWCVGEIPIGIS